jgi:hypothetical protein
MYARRVASAMAIATLASAAFGAQQAPDRIQQEARFAEQLLRGQDVTRADVREQIARERRNERSQARERRSGRDQQRSDESEREHSRQRDLRQEHLSR